MVKTVNISELPLWERADRDRLLLSIEFELTARCNNNCTHCYINLPENDETAKAFELSFDRICDLADEAADMGVLWVTLSGGEPLIREDFCDIYRYLKKKGLLVSVFTNASLITREHVDLFLKYPPRDIEVTVYGVTPEVHKKVTCKNTFGATMAGIDLLLDNGVPVTLKTTLTRSNFKSLPQIAAFCKPRSARLFRFDPVLHLRLDKDCVRNQRIEAERLTPDRILDIEASDTRRLEALKQKLKETGEPPFYSQDRLFRCNAGINSCCIDHKGQLKLCSSLSAEKFSIPLETAGLEKAWQAISTAPNQRSDDPVFIETCGSCALHSLCPWCPAHAELETGRLDRAVPYFCRIAEKRLAFLKPLITNDLTTQNNIVQTSHKEAK